MNSALSQKITVIITTKDRGDSVLSALDSIFANEHEQFYVVVVDQSTDNRTTKAVAGYLKNPNFSFIKSDSVGSSAGRNLAIDNAQTDLIAITDDDCEVSEDWLKNMVITLRQNEKIGIVYGKVEPGNKSDESNFITTFQQQSTYISKSIYNEHSLKGLSANMGIKKSLWSLLGGFDPMLGAGVRFNSCEETDLNIRALLNGYYIHYNPDICVKHHGNRNDNQARRLIRGYSYGNGALFAKHIKCGHYGMFLVLARQLVSWAFDSSWVMTGVEIQDNKTGRAASFLKGLYNGFITPIDKARGHFKHTECDG